MKVFLFLSQVLVPEQQLQQRPHHGNIFCSGVTRLTKTKEKNMFIKTHFGVKSWFLNSSCNNTNISAV